MIIVNQIKCTLDQTCTKEVVAKKLGCSVGDIHSFQILKESIDARKEPIQFVNSVLVDVKNEKRFLTNKDVTSGEKPTYTLPEVTFEATSRPIVVGFGPSGLFTSLLLAEAGYNPIVLERGSDVDQRILDVDQFWKQGILNPESNVQFGEGGAGTFSDGKLTTRIKDNRVIKVIDEFIEAGADESIRYEAHPHIGTDKLRDIVKNIRKKIIRLGGEVKFNTRFENLILNEGKITGVQTNQGSLDTDTVFLCLGHSAKDTIEKLVEQNVCAEPKSFAIGVRVEHNQQFIDKNQYGEFYNHPRLRTAEYHLTHTASNERGVYSFCMCPGGFVIPSSSIEKTLVINGMSEHARNQENANSAILVQVPIKDFYKGSVLDGFNYQEAIEKKAYELGGSNYNAPIQLIKDYLVDQVSTDFLDVKSSYCLGTTFADLSTLFSAEINTALKEAFIAFNRRIPGFSDGGGLMTGVETRSSSPVRLTRNDKGHSTTIENLYPCGEGAGYAGGIMSSAVDGIRIAEKYMTK